jgi:hypothetical protein
MRLHLINELATVWGHSANRKRYLDRFPSQYFRDTKPKNRNRKKRDKKNKKNN